MPKNTPSNVTSKHKRGGQRADAQTLTTSPERLRQIMEKSVGWGGRLYASEHRQNGTLAALARHPNIPPDLLVQLAAVFPEQAAANPVLPLLPLEMPDVLDRMNQHSPETVSSLLRVAELPGGFARFCIAHAEPFVAVMAREHISVAGEYTPDSDAWERDARTWLECLPAGDWDAVFELTEFGMIPEELVQCLGLHAVYPPLEADLAAFYAWEAFPPPTPRTPEERTAADPHTLPDTLTQLAKAGDGRRLRILARNPSAPPEALIYAASHSDSIREVIVHPNADARVYRRAAAVLGRRWKEWKDVVAYLIERPELSKLLPPFVGEGYVTGGVPLREPMNRRFQRWHPALCANPPEWPATGFEAFQTACSIPDVPDCISLDVPTFSPNREQATLSGFLYAVLLPLNRPTLTDLAERPEWYWRFAAALNPHTPEPPCQHLTNDGHRLVRAAARARCADPARPRLGIMG